MKHILNNFGKDTNFSEIKDRFKNHCKILNNNFYKQYNLNDNIFKIQPFEYYYSQCRKTRNKLAHNLYSDNEQINKKTLLSFIISYYILSQLLNHKEKNG